MRLLRGAGTTGLAGMRPVDPPFVRPLLPFSRDELVAWLAGQEGTFVFSWELQPAVQLLPVIVVPPETAALVPHSKSSAETVPSRFS